MEEPRYHVIDHWRTVASSYPRASHDGWSVTAREKAPGQYRMNGPSSFYYLPKAIELTALMEGERGWFDDDPRQMYALAEIGLFRARGRVIVGGLGLGLIQHFLALNENVTSVTTFERGEALKRLVWPYLIPEAHDKGQLIIGDFYERAPDFQADTVITDFLFGSWNETTWAELQAQREFCREHFPEAIFLEHGYQAKMDAETVAEAIPPSLIAPAGTVFDSVKVFR